MNFIKTKVLIILLTACFAIPFNVLGDGGEDYCGGKKNMNSKEKAWADSVVNRIKKALPNNYKEWKLDPRAIRVDLGKVCSKSGNPIDLEVRVSYTNEKKIKETSDNFVKNGDQIVEKMQELVEEINQAAQKGDQKKMQELQNKMIELQGGTSNDFGTTVEVRANSFMANASNYKNKPFSVSNTKFSFIIDEKNEKTVTIYLGNWRKSGENGVVAIPDRKLSNTSVSFIEIVIKGGIADIIAQSIKIDVLNSLLK